VKTSKCPPVVRAQLAAGARGITVSTLKEAQQFCALGITDILYAVGMVPAKLPQALELRRRGCDLKLIVDNVAAARAIADFGGGQGEVFEVWIEIDCDGHRSGIVPEDDRLLEVGRAMARWRRARRRRHDARGLELRLRQPCRPGEDRRAGTRRAACVRRSACARRVCNARRSASVRHLRRCPAERLDGVTEVRAGVYVFFDLVMHNVGVVRHDDIALSILTTVIGHQEEKGGRSSTRAGWR
jgi:D-serine deaminase-like pyridoxal phosphate-dependent protein